MEDLKTVLKLLIRQTEEMGKILSNKDYIDGKLDAFNLILEYVNEKTQ